MNHIHGAQMKESQNANNTDDQLGSNDNYVVETEEHSLTELITFDPTEFYAESNDSDPMQNGGMISVQPANLFEENGETLYTVGKPRNNIMSQIDNLSQYKSTPMVKTKLDVNIQVTEIFRNQPHLIFLMQETSEFYIDNSQATIEIPYNVIPILEPHMSAPIYRPVQHEQETSDIELQNIENVPRRQSVIRLNQKS